MSGDGWMRRAERAVQYERMVNSRVGSTLQLVVACAVAYLVVFDLNSLAVALSSIGEEFEKFSYDAQLLIGSYALVFGGLLVLGGRAADLHGRKRTLLLGVGLFTAAGLVGASAVSWEMLMGARIVQGVGAAFAMPAALSMLTSGFAEGEQRNRALGIFGTVTGGALIVGVAAGGAVTEMVGWRGVFALNVVAGAIAWAGAAILVPETDRQAGRLRDNLAFIGTVTVGLICMLSGLTYATVSGWHGELIFAVVAGILSVAGGVLSERSAGSRLFKPGLLRQRTVGAATLGALATVGTGMGVLVTVSLFVQEVQGYSALEAGLMIAPLGVGGLVAGKVSARLANRFGAAPVLAGAMVVQAAGVLAMAGLGATRDPVTVAVGFTIMGMGHFGAIVAFTALGASGVDGRDQGLVVGAVNAAQQVGGAFGVAALVSVTVLRSVAELDAGEHVTEALVTGYEAALWGGAMLSVLGALLVLGIMRGRGVRVGGRRLGTDE